MISLATLGREAGYVDAMLGRQPRAAQHFDHVNDDGERYRDFAQAYFAAYRAARRDYQ